jgi:chromosome segregation ATPase
MDLTTIALQQARAASFVNLSLQAIALFTTIDDDKPKRKKSNIDLKLAPSRQCTRTIVQSKITSTATDGPSAKKRKTKKLPAEISITLEETVIGNELSSLESSSSEATSCSSDTEDKKKAYATLLSCLSSTIADIQSEMKEMNRILEENNRIEEQNNRIEEESNRIEEQNNRIEEQNNRIAKQNQLIALAQHLGKQDILEGMLENLTGKSGNN